MPSGLRISKYKEHRLGLKDTFPPSFIEHFRNLSASDDVSTPETVSSSSDRPAKRAKTQPAECPSIHIANCNFTISRKHQDDSPDFTIVLQDIGRYLTLQNWRDELMILGKRKPPDEFRAYVSYPSIAISKYEKCFISYSAPGSSEIGAVWTKINLTIERRKRLVSMNFHIELHWNETPSPYHEVRKPQKGLGRYGYGSHGSLVDTIFPRVDTSSKSSAWSPKEFYEAAYVPPKDDAIADSIEVPGLQSTLFSYQKRSLKWLLNREGVDWERNTREIKPLEEREASASAHAFRPVKDANGDKFYFSDVFRVVTRDTTLFRQAESAVKGGILAEEMGLGKTLEILGLILLHPRSLQAMSSSPEATASLTPSGATLIVVPESLRAQWMSEIARHAPGLTVRYYPGRKKVAETDESELVKHLAACDIVITTYRVLTAEMHYTIAPPERPRRHERTYQRLNSPFQQISWWRVCLDEAQMVGGGISQAAKVARGIPRINSWGITGTPVKKDVKDLQGLVQFLHCEPYCSVNRVWEALIKDNKPTFHALFNIITLRHTKTMVRDELSLPPQRRYVISMPFTAVEEQHYQSLCQEMATECDLSVDGDPLLNGWDPQHYEEKMRRWLNRLRQTALHPEVAVNNRRALGSSKSRPIRTVDEVLDAMLEQSENSIRLDERAYLSSKLTRGQLYENSPRVREALEIWEAVKDETVRLVSDARRELHELDGGYFDRIGGGPGADDTDESDDADDDIDENDNKVRLGDCRRRLRGALEMQHKAVFFCANAYFQIRDNPEMTDPESQEFHNLKKLEDEGYERAKLIRREILLENHRKATRLMDSITRKASGQSFVEVAELAASPEKGIESSAIVEDLEDLYGELNEQANIIDEWREHVIKLLLQPLVDEEDEVEITGEELADSAKTQEELMAYVTALRAAIADRQDAITGQTNELIKYDTATAIRLAMEGNGPAPEQLLQLLQIRSTVKPKPELCSMRGALSNFRALITRLEKDATSGSQRAALESSIAKKHMKETHTLLGAQNKAALALETEIESFTTTMNARLEYYRQLQGVSDSVLPYEGARTAVAMDKMKQNEEVLRKRLAAAEAKHRYLLHLKEAGNKSNEPRICVICQSPFSMGVLTVCGHQFCKECMMLWFKTHHNCPVCKKELKASSLHDITINPQQLKVHGEGAEEAGKDEEQSPLQKRHSSSKKTGIYSEFNSEKLAEIQNIQLDGPSFTTKVDTIVKHLLWLRDSDPGAKSIIFSQYKDFLTILRNAFSHFRVGYASIDDQGGITKFKEDPAVECFLLHARAHSSGLNLVNANHVFLCEPLLNTALELQAIARVDRIGQESETTVWLYLVSGTIEESIYNLSVRRRMEHMDRNIQGKGKSKESTPELLDASIEAANTLELEQAALSKLMSKDKTAGEMVDKSDLWECLFGHVARRDNEPGRDNRVQEQAVMGYLAAEAAEARRDEQMAE